MDKVGMLLQKYDFEGESLPNNLALNSKRNELLLSYQYAAHNGQEWLAAQELEVQLDEYYKRVDDRKGLNNFAALASELCSKLRKDCRGWKSSLNISNPSFDGLLNESIKDCLNPSNDGCEGNLPAPEDLEDFRMFTSQEHLGLESQNGNLGDGRERFTDGPSLANTGMPPATFLAPQSSNSNPQRSHDYLHHARTDSKEPVFVPKRPLSRVEREEPPRASTLGPGRALTERKIDGFTGYPMGGGVYTNRVGGRFKKWGKERPDDSGGNDENVFDKGYKNSGGRASHQSTLPNEDTAPYAGPSGFITAGDQLKIDVQKKHGNHNTYNGNSMEEPRWGFSSRPVGGSSNNSYGNSDRFCGNTGGAGRGGYTASFGAQTNSSIQGVRGGQGGAGYGTYHPIRSIKKSLGGKGVVNNRFVPPMRNNVGKSEPEPPTMSNSPEEEVDERLKNIEPRMIELIKNEIMDCGSKITWNDIAGLHFAKNTIQEIVVWPMLRPDIFTGLRRPPKGILLFGPPGTGKTLIGKCIASQSGSTFFSISASSLTSKWIGEGEKMVRALFAVARVHQPAVVFIDEIDSLLSQRSETEHESSRRIKTEFLVQLDGAGTDEEDRLLVIGATNRPQELDEAARRRLVKRLYIPLPDLEARKEMIVQLMKFEPNDLTEHETDELAKSTDGFSGADMKHLCQEACLGPIRSLGPSQISSIAASQVRPVSMSDFTSALKRVHPSVGQDDLHQYVTWNKTYGSGS